MKQDNETFNRSNERFFSCRLVAYADNGVIWER